MCVWGGQLVLFGRPSYVPWPSMGHGSVIDIWQGTVTCNSDSIYCASCSLRSLLVTLRVVGTQHKKLHLFVLLAAGQCRCSL